MKETTFQQAALLREKKTSLEEIARSTKINIHYLRAIEEQRFERLPGGTYNTNYIRQYAKAFGFDDQELQAAYNRLVTPAPEPLPRPRGRIPSFLSFALGRTR